MNLNFCTKSIPLRKPFTISRGTVSEQPVLFLALEYEGVTGFGEATANDYYGHTLESIASSIERVRPDIESLTPTSAEDVWDVVHEILAGDSFATSAIDMAAHDLFGKLDRLRCYEQWGLTWTDNVASSLTLGINSIDAMVADLKENPGWPAYKVKLGTLFDLEIIHALRKHTDKALRVDANCAWTADETIEKSKELARLGVEFIEQPLLPNASEEDMQRIFRNSKLPIIADESCQREADVAVCQNYFHGINVKLCKCGGLTPAVNMLKHARSLGMRTMVGCMVETSIGISAASQLLPLLDYADLDGALLLGNDPATGVSVDRGVVSLAKSYGCGSHIELGAPNLLP